MRPPHQTRSRWSRERNELGVAPELNAECCGIGVDDGRPHCHDDGHDHDNGFVGLTAGSWSYGQGGRVSPFAFRAATIAWYRSFWQSLSAETFSTDQWPGALPPVPVTP